MQRPSSPSGNGSAGPPYPSAGHSEATASTNAIPSTSILTSSDLSNAGGALVAKADYLFWVVDNKKNWTELLEEAVPVPIFTAREVLRLWPAQKSEFDLLFRVKKVFPSARMVEFRLLGIEKGEVDPETD